MSKIKKYQILETGIVSFETICPKCGNIRTKLIGEELKCLRCSYFPLQVIKVNK